MKFMTRLTEPFRGWRWWWKARMRKTNCPDHHNKRGHRIFVKAGVNEVKRFCKKHGLHPKEIRVAANITGWTEVIHTENPGHNYPSIYMKLKETTWEIR